MLNKYRKWFIPLMVGSALMAGCSTGGSKPAASPGGNSSSPTVSKEPISLMIYYNIPFDQDQKYGVVEKLKAKYPNITFNFVTNGKGTSYQDIIAGGNLPDIVYDASSFTTSNIMRYNFQYDISDLVKKHNFDLNRIDPNILATLKSYNADQKLYGLPYDVNKYVTFYNKDVFDKLGVAYPKDGMTWDDAYELAKKLTRVDGGTSYQGMLVDPGLNFLNNQLSLNPLDLKEDKSAVNTDGWKTLFENMARFYELPNTQMLPQADFTKGNIAMAVQASPKVIDLLTKYPNINFDLVSVPTMKEKPNTGYKAASLSYFVSATSKHKDEAFDVIATLMSDEFQTIISQQGVAPTVVTPSVRDAFGQALPGIKGKNTHAVFYYPDALPSPPRAAGLVDVSVDFNTAFAGMIKNQTDVNTTLQQLDEKVNHDIAAKKADAGKK